MYMDGFRFTVFSNDQPCLNFFFSKWRLNSTPKFMLALFGVFFLGAAAEGLSYFVRFCRIQPIYNTGCLSFLHILQAMLGYLNMLVVMTFSIELFIMLLAGLGVGHYYFFTLKSREKTAVLVPAHSADIPCCDFLASNDDLPIIGDMKQFENDNSNCILPLIACTDGS